MHSRLHKIISMLIVVTINVLPAVPAFADEGNGPNGEPGRVSSIAAANTKSVGVPAPNVFSPELIATLVAQGATRLENPSDLTSFYGYDNDGPLVPVPGDLPSAVHTVKATSKPPGAMLEFPGFSVQDPCRASHVLLRSNGTYSRSPSARTGLSVNAPIST